MATKKSNKEAVIKSGDSATKKFGQIEVLERDYKLAYGLAVKAAKKFKTLIKGFIMFGSAAKRTAKSSSDVDVAVIVDDASIKWDEEAIAWYREELEKLMAGMADADRLHINTITLSSFWENLLVGEPAALNILRYGVPILDQGFITPMKYLLYMGRVRPSPEAVYNTIGRVPWHIFRGRTKIMGAIGDFYWAFVDSSHGPLMQAGFTPPSPENVPELLEKAFVETRKLDGKYVSWYREIYELAHRMKNNEVQSVAGHEYDKWLERTEEFTKIMHRLFKAEEATHKHYKLGK
ncbi:MAG: nucleotidyltransferase domain-containing protein [DPANN group archaeon]|nr:nucleotidyltransferase domain-containing protein [DPANN group archaeon]